MRIHEIIILPESVCLTSLTASSAFSKRSISISISCLYPSQHSSQYSCCSAAANWLHQKESHAQAALAVTYAEHLT